MTSTLGGLGYSPTIDWTSGPCDQPCRVATSFKQVVVFHEKPSLKRTVFFPLKMDGWKIILSFWVSAHFQGPAVSFREGNIIQLLDKNIERLFNWFLHQCRLSIPKGQWCYHIYISQNMRINFPIQSMYGIFPYIWLMFMVNVGNYTIHWCYGFGRNNQGVGSLDRIEGFSAWCWLPIIIEFLLMDMLFWWKFKASNVLTVGRSIFVDVCIFVVSLFYQMAIVSHRSCII